MLERELSTLKAWSRKRAREEIEEGRPRGIEFDGSNGVRPTYLPTGISIRVLSRLIDHRSRKRGFDLARNPSYVLLKRLVYPVAMPRRFCALITTHASIRRDRWRERGREACTHMGVTHTSGRATRPTAPGS